MNRIRNLSLVIAAAATVTIAAPATAQASFGPEPPQNPATAANGTATMHADSASSGTAPLPGPGNRSVTGRYVGLAAACPTVLTGHDGYPFAICTTILGRTPTIHLLDPKTGASLAELPLATAPGGDVLGGIYAYLDNNDRVVVVDGDNTLLRVGHKGRSLYVASRIPLGPKAANVVGLAPDWRRRIWFATASAVVGVVDPVSGRTATLSLPKGEQVANSISTVPEGTAVATDHALYLLRADRKGRPEIVWRAPYDRGPARKPGQLSHGTGATPAFFGPEHGTEYVAITDNAVPREHLLVYRTTGGLVCKVPVLTRSGSESGTENAPVASGRSVFVADTFGYPYPALPPGAEPSSPAQAPFTGGITRIDLRRDGRGCVTRWNDAVRSATVPRLSLADGKLYTVARVGLFGTASTSIFDRYDLTVVDAGTGRTDKATLLGAGELFDTLQMAGTLVPGRIFYQGTITGVVRVAP